FTGSTATGRAIMAAAAPTLKKVFLELGGAVQLTATDAALWIGFGSDARLSVARADLFHEQGGAARLTAADSALYIEVIP
ncbi:aldehyde dehydrogenase family protein, partial [Brevundimonas sp.]|uniref:aldehyde dehydrogenase family protein n=1 Tax=Brevundimonas sp. TaxID=1871086 RepID=UPI0025C4B901